MKAKYVYESFGSGFSMTGGGMRGMSGRGGGFGGGSNLSGPNMMYTYEIKPLNAVLQQKKIQTDNFEEIHTGLTIKGKKIGDEKGKNHKGKVLQIIKTPEGALKYYVILSDKTAIKIKINPTTAEIVHETPLMYGEVGDNVLQKGYKLREGLVPESLEQCKI